MCDFRILLLVLFVSVVQGVKAQSQGDPFYKYGFPHDQIFTNIDKAHKEAKKVTKLNLSNVDLSLKLNKMARFKNLKVLQLTNNKIDSLPLKLYNNYGLRYFLSEGNRLEKLAENISNWKMLEVMKLYKVALDSLPFGFSQLKLLKTLEIQSNESDTFFVNNVFSNLLSLEELILYKVNLFEFPQQLGKAKDLKGAYFIDCRLSKLDSSFFKCHKLELLVLDQNNLKKIPKKITRLKDLKVLSLKNNKIKHLPEFLSRLTQLEKIELRGNPIPRHEIEVLKILMPKCQINY